MIDIEIVIRANRKWATIWTNSEAGEDWIIKAGLINSSGIIPTFLVQDYLNKIKNSHLKVKVITYDD